MAEAENEPSNTILTEAREAWTRKASGPDWTDWIIIGRGLQECQRLALETAKSNDIRSNAYRTAMSKVLEVEQLDRIDKGDRSQLLAVMSDLPAITTWRDALTMTDRLRINHPRTVMTRYKRAKMPAPKPDGNGEVAAPRGFRAAFQASEAAFQVAEAENSALKQRLKPEGSPFDLQSDSPVKIARAVVGNVDAARAASIARAITKLLVTRKKPVGERKKEGPRGVTILK